MSERPIERRRWGIDKTYGEKVLERMLPMAKEFRAKYDALLAALEFYADKGNWETEVNRYGEPNCTAYDDEGETARAAIAKAKEPTA